MPKYGIISDLYFPVFGLNTGKYGPEETPYLDTFHAVEDSYLRQFLLLSSFPKIDIFGQSYIKTAFSKITSGF